MNEQRLSLPPRSVFATLVLAADGRSRTVNDLSNQIVELRNTLPLDTSDISIRADRGGWISDDLASFVYRLVLFGYATDDPLELSDEGRELCRKMLDEELSKYPDEITKLKQAVEAQVGLSEQHA